MSECEESNKIITYNKLVRDKIKERMEKNGVIPITRILTPEEHFYELKRKAVEEAKELLESGELSELADLKEILETMYKFVDVEELEKLQKQKRLTHGGFDTGLYLIEERKK